MAEPGTGHTEIDRMVEPENHVALIHDRNIYSKLKHKVGLTSILPTDIIVSVTYFGLDSDAAAQEMYFLKASHLHEAGLIAQAKVINQRKHDHRQYIGAKMKIGPQVLTLTELKAGFVLFCSFLSLSLFAFVLECCWYYFAVPFLIFFAVENILKVNFHSNSV